MAAIARVEWSTRCVEASVGMADAVQAAMFDAPAGSPVLRWWMLVVVGGRNVAVTEETFSAGIGTARRNRPGRRRSAGPRALDRPLVRCFVGGGVSEGGRYARR